MDSNEDLSAIARELTRPMLRRTGVSGWIVDGASSLGRPVGEGISAFRNGLAAPANDTSVPGVSEWIQTRSVPANLVEFAQSMNTRPWDFPENGPSLSHRLGAAYQLSSERLGSLTSTAYQGLPTRESVQRRAEDLVALAADYTQRSKPHARSAAKAGMKGLRAAVRYLLRTYERVFTGKHGRQWYKSGFSRIVQCLNLVNLARPELSTASTTVVLEGIVFLCPERVPPHIAALISAWRCLGAMRAVRDMPTGHARQTRETRALAWLHKTTGMLTTLALVADQPEIGYAMSGSIAGLTWGIYLLSVCKTNRSWVVETLPDPVPQQVLTTISTAYDDLVLEHVRYLPGVEPAGGHVCDATCDSSCNGRILVHESIPHGTDIYNDLPCIVRGKRDENIIFRSDIAIEHFHCGQDDDHMYTVIQRYPGTHLWFQPELGTSVGHAQVNITHSHIEIGGHFGRESIPIGPIITTAYGVADRPRETQDDIAKLTVNIRSLLLARLQAERVDTKYPDILMLVVARMSDSIYVNFNHQVCQAAGTYSFYGRAIYNLFDFARGSQSDIVLTNLVQKNLKLASVLPWKYVCTPVPQYTMIIGARNVQFSKGVPRNVGKQPFPNAGTGSTTTTNNSASGNPGQQSGQHGGVTGNQSSQHGAHSVPPANGPSQPSSNLGSGGSNQQSGPPPQSQQHAPPPFGGGLPGPYGGQAGPQAGQVPNPGGPAGRCCGACQGHDPRVFDPPTPECECPACVATGWNTWNGRHIPLGHYILDVLTGTFAGDARVIAVEAAHSGITGDIYHCEVLRGAMWQADVREPVLRRALAGYSLDQASRAFVRFDEVVGIPSARGSGSNNLSAQLTRFAKLLSDGSRDGLTPDQSIDRACTRILGNGANGMGAPNGPAPGFRPMGAKVPRGSTGAAPRGTGPSSTPGPSDFKRQQSRQFSQSGDDSESDRSSEHRAKAGRFYGGARPKHSGRRKARPPR